MRKQAKSPFEKNFYKLMSNACFGKTMENKRNRRNVHFVSNEQEAMKFTSKPNYKSFQIISENLCSVSLSQQKIFWDKPTPVGAAILDLSKLSLYGFHYNEMKPRYGQKILVTYKDTDSFLYRVETDDLYEDMKEFKHLDLSDYPSDHPLFDPTNKKVPLTMTDELNGQILEEAVLLRSKMYSIKYRGGAKQSAKGVQKSVKKSLHHDKFVNCLKNRTTERAPMTRITSENHQIIVTMTNKIALSCFDDKRYIFEPGIDTLPHGHFWLNQERESSKHANGDCETSFYQFCESDGGESSTESASDCSELTLVGQQNNSDERAAAATDTFDVPDPGFLPRDLHADSDESNIVDWDALSTTDDAEESDSRRNPFIDDEAIEEADRVDDEDDEDGYDDVDDCGGGGGGGGGDDDGDDDNGGGGDGDDEQAEENDLKLSSSCFPRSKRRRLTTTLLDSD